MLMIPAVGSGTYSPGPNHMVVPPHSSSLSSQKRLEPQYKRDRPTRLHRSQNPRYSLRLLHAFMLHTTLGFCRRPSGSAIRSRVPIIPLLGTTPPHLRL